MCGYFLCLYVVGLQCTKIYYSYMNHGSLIHTKHEKMPHINNITILDLSEMLTCPRHVYGVLFESIYDPLKYIIWVIVSCYTSSNMAVIYEYNMLFITKHFIT